MTEHHKRGRDGLLSDGVSTYPATTADLGTYAQAQLALSQLQTPVLYHASNPHERLFVACFDGTGNDAIDDPEHATHVGRFKEELKALNGRNSHIDFHYVKGPGTQDGFVSSLIDKATGHTYSTRLEEMYEQLMRQAYTWRQQDPKADIRVIATGFSRGAEQDVGFARLLHERGIQDRQDRVITRNSHGRFEVEYTRPPLIPPGQVAQAVGLFDPVGTGEPSKHDRRLPSSVLSAVQIVARDEMRDAFPSTRIVPQGFSEDGRTLGVTVAGAHSNIGGSYHLNGLGARSGNLMVDYLNSLSDTPLLQKQPEPLDPRLNVIHRTEEHVRVMGINVYGTSNFREDGLRDEAKPAPFCRAVCDCGPPEPVDAVLNARFERHVVTIAPSPAWSADAQVEGQIRVSREALSATRPDPTMPGTRPGLDFNAATPQPVRGHFDPFQHDHPAHQSDREVQGARTTEAVLAPNATRSSGFEREPLSYTDPAHPHHPLFKELRHRLPADASDDKVAELTLAARQGGVRPNRVDSVHILDNGDAWVLGTIPGFDGTVNLRTPAPPINETMQKAEAFEQQHQAQVAQWQEQRQSQSQGRSM